MPEGPEIQIQADKISSVLAGHKLVDSYFYHDKLATEAARINGQKIKSVEPYGKAIVIGLSGGRSIYSHNQLYGKWVTTKGPLPPQDANRSLRVKLSTKVGTAFLLSASDIELLDSNKVREHPYIKKLGPNCLDDEVTWQDVKKRLKSAAFRNRTLSSLLLDQSFIAGLGNYLRSEILFESRLLHHHRPAQMGTRHLDRLARAILRLPRRSYMSGGITRNVRNAKADMRKGQEYERSRFWVFGRQDAACRLCESKIMREDIGQRGIYYCPSCQN